MTVNIPLIILVINKSVIDDLDALYFRDKVHMRHKSSLNSSNFVPKLSFPSSGPDNQPIQVKKKETTNTKIVNIFL